MFSLDEVATDVKWLKQAVEANAIANTNDHRCILAKLETYGNRIQACETKGKDNRTMLVWLASSSLVILTGIVYYVLRHIGFPQN